MNTSRLMVLFSLCITNVFSQYTESELTDFINHSSEQELVMESSLLMRQGFYYNAEKIVDKLLEIKPESSNYNYRKGYLALQLRFDYNAATPYLEKAVKDVDKNYDINSASEESASLDAIYHLACCYHAEERIAEAKKLFEQYISKIPKNAPLVPLAKLRIKQCEVAEKLLKTPNKNVSVKNAGPVINSIYPDYSSVIGLDQSSIFYTSRRPWEDGSSEVYADGRNNLHPEDVYVSYADPSGNWTTPERLGICKSEYNEATVAVNADERRIYTYNDEAGGDIYYSDFSNSRFNEVKWLDVPEVNTKNWEPHITLSPDGSRMYFVSNRPGGFGGRDIYEVLKGSDGKWGKPKNMGSSINTPYEEDSPFISIDGKKLYFSSNGAKSMGGFDIMISEKKENGDWAESVNLGYPVNSCGDDLYYSTTIDGYVGYFSSFRKGGYGEKDIYEVVNNYLGVDDVSFLKVKFHTPANQSMPEDVAFTYKCTDCPETHEGTVFPRMRDGLAITSLQPCKTYEIIYHYSAEKKEAYRETLKTACATPVEEIYKEVLLDVEKKTIVPFNVKRDSVVELVEVPVEANKPLEMKYMFKYNDSKFSIKGREYRRFLRDIEDQLKANGNNVTIKIHSSASKVPTKKYGDNEVLAKLRAENAKYDIITHFQEKTKMANRLIVVIVSSAVNGPDYEGDNRNTEKYGPYQFVLLKTE